MRLRLITTLSACLLFVMVFTRCGQTASPVDRHIGHLILTRHARCRMDCRHITEKEIREILEEGEINYRKSEPDSHPDPKYALEGYTKEGQHLRVVFAVPSGRSTGRSDRKGEDDTGRKREDNSLVVVTCIELGVEWQCDCR